MWEVRDRQIFGAEQVSDFAESRIFVEWLDSNTSVIVISGKASSGSWTQTLPGSTYSVLLWRS